MKNRIIIWFRSSISGWIFRRTESRDLKRDLYIHVHRSMTPHSQKIKTMPLHSGRQMDKLRHTHIMKYYLVLKRKEILKHELLWKYCAKWTKLVTKSKIWGWGSWLSWQNTHYLSIRIWVQSPALMWKSQVGCMYLSIQHWGSTNRRSLGLVADSLPNQQILGL